MIKLNEKQLKEAKEIKADSRYDALEKLAKVLEANTIDNMRWTKCSRCLTSDGCKIDITTKKTKDSVEIKRIDVFGVNKEWDTYTL